jgi:nitrogen regulatory protein PII
MSSATRSALGARLPTARAFAPRARVAARRAPRAALAPRASGTLAPVSLDDGAAFYAIKAVIRPWRLDDILAALDAQGIRGVTTYEVSGAGVQAGAVERYRGASYDETTHTLVAKTVVEVVLAREQVQEIVDCVVDAAQTGEIGDGKIFISPVSDIVRIRTGEVGADAERMEGGKASRKAAEGP